MGMLVGRGGAIVPCRGHSCLPGEGLGAHDTATTLQAFGESQRRGKCSRCNDRPPLQHGSQTKASFPPPLTLVDNGPKPTGGPTPVQLGTASASNVLASFSGPVAAFERVASLQFYGLNNPPAAAGRWRRALNSLGPLLLSRHPRPGSCSRRHPYPSFPRSTRSVASCPQARRWPGTLPSTLPSTPHRPPAPRCRPRTSMSKGHAMPVVGARSR